MNPEVWIKFVLEIWKFHLIPRFVPYFLTLFPRKLVKYSWTYHHFKLKVFYKTAALRRFVQNLNSMQFSLIISFFFILCIFYFFVKFWIETFYENCIEFRFCMIFQFIKGTYLEFGMIALLISIILKILFAFYDLKLKVLFKRRRSRQLSQNLNSIPLNFY
jgi:hypothetical protein